MNEFIITFRECLEASLIVGILFTILDKNGFHHQKKMLWLSVFSAIVCSAILGVILNKIIENTGSEASKALLEGILMYITAGLLFYVIFWMSKTFASRKVITDQTNTALSNGKKWGFFFLVFFAILREGFETALFLIASTAIDSSFSYGGFILGVLLAAIIGYLIVAQGKKIELKKFFSITSLLLVFFAAGMVAYGTHELHEYLEEKEAQKTEIVKIIEAEDAVALQNAELDNAQKPAIEKVEKKAFSILENKTEKDMPSQFWYKKDGEKYVHLLNDKGSIGVFLKGLFGYNSDPIWIEVILWILSLCFGLIIWYRAYVMKRPQPLKSAVK